MKNLSAEFIEHVLPTLPTKFSTSTGFDRETANAAMEKMAAGKQKGLETYWPHLMTDVETEETKIQARDGAQLAVRIYRSAKSTSTGLKPAVFSMHGGGFVTGSIDSEDLINRQYCSVNDVIIFGLEYRLAPEHKVVPTLMNDAEDGFKWTYQNASKYGADMSGGLIVSGTSAGGLLAVTMAYRAPKLHIPVRGVISRQPVFIYGDWDKVNKAEWKGRLNSHVENAEAPVYNTNTHVSLVKLCNVSEEEATDPNNFSIFASTEQLKGLPPMYFVEAELCPCVDEIGILKDSLTKAGVTFKSAIYEGVPHGFHAFHSLKAARQEMVDTANGMKWLLSL